MQHLGLLFVLLLIVLNIWGVTLLTGTIWRNRWMALAAGPWLATTVMFMVESYHGLGRLHWFGMFTTLTSAALVAVSAGTGRPKLASEGVAEHLRRWREEFAPRRMGDCGGVFLALFGYALLWRFTYPNIDGSSEKLADFSYICSYYTGATIPVPDAWLAPYLSTQYYSFQHYAAALIGRMLGMPLGTAYNLGFCLLIALGGVACAGAVFLATGRRWVRWAVIVSFVIGGTGASGLVHLTEKDPQPWSSMRFIGSALLNQPPVGTRLKAYADNYKQVELPGEPYAYSIYLGDYHAPLASYYLLGVAVLGVLLWQRHGQKRHVALVGATLTWSLLANTWSLPLQGLGVGCWLALNFRQWRHLMPALAFGALSIWLATWVYLAVFTSAASGYGTSIKMVAPDMHAPPLLAVLFLLPTIGLAILGLASGERRGRWLGAMWLLFLAVSEFVFVDDVYGGTFERFNTSLKWWPLIAAGALITLGPVVLGAARRRGVRIAGAILCIYPCAFAWDLGVACWHGPKEAVGKIEGHYFLTKEMFPRMMLARLKVEPSGVVIERPTKDAFTNSACLPLFAGHRMWLGWVGHEQLWRGYREDIPQRQERLFSFYNGELPEPAAWLDAQSIDLVLWYQLPDTTELWRKINRQLTPHYVWVEIFTHDAENGRKLGFWRRAARGGSYPSAGPGRTAIF